MADVQDGLEVGADASELDVNTTAGFTAALAAQAGRELSSDQIDELKSHDTSVAGGITTQESPEEQPRDELGRFAPATTPVEETPTEGTAPEEETAQVDPEVAALLERHDGDHVAALAELFKQNADAQAFAGRQSNEVGELRERLAKLEGAQEERARQPEPVLSAPSVETIENAVAERGGAQVINDLAQAGYPDGHPAYELAYDAWVGEEPGPATRWYNNYRDAMRETAATPAEPQQDQRLEQFLQEREINTMLEGVAARHADLDSLPIQDVIDDPATPDFIKAALDSTDVSVQEQALESVIVLARARSTNDATQQAQQQIKEGNREKKLAASVATGSLRPAPERQPEAPEEPTKEEAIKSFQDRILGIASRSSVQSGLTFAK